MLYVIRSLDAILSALQLHADTLKDMFIAASDGGSIRQTTLTYSIMLFSSLSKLAIQITYLDYCKGSNYDLVIPP